ncbi:MAG: nuclear transport factor 2 family protein [Candidatus Eremiobacteraeota bacterium]|nr:nuclear transport factor 2 family protein [Candidatus Eremiobacteraeota bacterium]
MRGKRRPPDANADSLTALLDAFARGDLSTAAGCFSADATYREPSRTALAGREAIAAHFARFAASGVAWTFTVDEVIANGARACVVYRFTASGGDGEPRRERAGCAVVRIDERGEIAEWREYEG